MGVVMSESFSIDICVDCMLDLANGECGNEDEHGCNERSDWPDWSGYHIALGDLDDRWFSWSSCDMCNSHLGGDRYEATAFTRSEDGL